ncbi:hypothetical protein BG003_006977 [Podila horticola]|nr:hypothetical protein BG003_006977 [Podila horticola]
MLCAPTANPSSTYTPINIERTMASTTLASRSSSPVYLPEIISAIVSYLDQANLARAARISQTWASICLPILYREIRLSSRNFNIKSLELGLKKHGHYSQKLFAARDVNHWCSRIRAALLNMPNLVQLDALWMNADLLESVIELQHLERLSAPRMQGSHPDDHSYFLPSFTGSSKITHLDMSDSHLVHDKVLVQITRACPQIEVLALSGNSCLTHAGLIEWCNGDLYLSDPSSSTSLSQDSLLTQPKRPLFTTSLTSINFSNCNKIETEGFEALFQHSHRLQDLNLMSTKVGDTALEILADNNKHLRSLVLTCCAAISAQGLSRILRTSRELESVSFMYCSRVSAMVFFQLPLWTCTQLRELRFSLNKRHLDWVENGLSAAESASMVAMAQLLDSGNNINNNNATGNDTTGQDTSIIGDIHVMDLLAEEGSEFHEPLFQHFVEGIDIPISSPSDDDTSRKSTDSTHPPLLSSLVTLAPPTTIQQYRQRMILAQLYRQIERLTHLRVLDMRDLHLPLDLDSGLWRLGNLRQLEMLEWTGLQAPLREQEVAWLTSGESDEKTLPVLRQLLIKDGHGMSTVERAVLQAGRPELDLQLIQVREMA